MSASMATSKAIILVMLAMLIAISKLWQSTVWKNFSVKVYLILEYNPVVAWVLFKEVTFSGKTHPMWLISIARHIKWYIISVFCTWHSGSYLNLDLFHGHGTTL